MRVPRLLRRIEHLEVDRVAAIDQRRIADQRLRAALDLHHLVEVARTIQSVRPVCAAPAPAIAANCSPASPAQLGAQLREVASHAELAAVLVDDAEVHRQVRRQRLRPEGVERELEVERLPRVPRDGLA